MKDPRHVYVSGPALGTLRIPIQKLLVGDEERLITVLTSVLEIALFHCITLQP